MEKQQKKRIKKYTAWALLAATVAALAFLPMIAASEEPASGPQASILSAEAISRDISSVILGGGTLTAESIEEITIPAEVKVTEYLVRNGDLVEEGQPIAAVDRVSVMTAISQVQETLKSLQSQLDAVSDDADANAVTATAGGTVKAIYATQGENVQDVMLRHGALAVLSLDDLMAVQIEASTGLSAGDTVSVMLRDGTEVDGKVESNLEGVLTITVEDDGFQIGEEVQTATKDGDRIGSGKLYIHSQWDVVAYSGTVSKIRVNEGDSVKAGKTLFNLKDTGHTAKFEALAQQHREYEELMLELFKMYQSETVTAPSSGMVTGVDENGTYMLSGSGSGWTVSLLANGPGGDEAEYINFVGMVTEVGIDGLIIKLNPQAISVTDYHDLTGVPLNTDLMTQRTTYSGSAPIYVLSEVISEGGTGSAPSPDPTAPSDPADPTDPTASTDPAPAPDAGSQITKEWVQISPYAITAGDILLFAGSDSGIVWVIKVSHTDISQPNQSGGNRVPGGSYSGMGSGGRTGGGAGGSNQDESSDLYALDTLTIASVTAQEQLTVQITVDELDITQISIGQRVQITMDALNGEHFTGTVTEISNSGVSEGGNSKFTVTVAVSKTENMLPGMTAHVSIPLSHAENALCLPVAALTEAGSETIVYTAYSEETEEFTGPIRITTGISDGEYVQILSGIEPGQTVYYPYYDTLVIDTTPERSGGFRFR